MKATPRAWKALALTVVLVGVLHISTSAHAVRKPAVHKPLGSISVGAGGVHACVVSTNGSVWCAGANQWGYLGDNTTADRSVPVRVTGITNATQVGGGGNSTCVLTREQTVICFGDNRFGLVGLGNFDIDQSANRRPVNGINEAVQVSVSGAHACALLRRGTVKCWGLNYDGQLGNGKKSSDDMAKNPDAKQGVSEAVTVNGITGAVQVSTGATHSCALLNNGTVACWGANDQGQLGDGTTTHSAVAVTVQNINNATKIALGAYFSCALTKPGSVICWGSTEFQQQIETPRLVPRTVQDLPRVSLLVAGDYHVCVEAIGGDILCWGGYLSDRTDLARTIEKPQVVVSGSNIVEMSAGHVFTCALYSDKGVRCWGNNDNGQFGNGTTTSGSTPAPRFQA